MHKLALVFIVVAASASWAQSVPTEPDYKLLNAVGSCRTVSCILQHQPSAHAKLERTVLYAKWLLLEPSSRTASRGLLENLPATDGELAGLMTLPDWHEGATTTTTEMKALANVYENWPRLISIAVRRFPEYLSTYIRYGRLAVNDIHSNYTGYERDICRANRKAFVVAFSSLTEDDQQYIRRYVFNPDACRPIFVSEAE